MTRRWARCAGLRSPTARSWRAVRRPAPEGVDMSTRGGWLACAAIVAAAMTAPLAAQPAAKERAAPRTAAGKPDLSGIWVATGAILLFEGEEAFAAARAADAAAGRPPGNSNEMPPYKPEAEAQRQYYVSRRGIDDPMARCLLTGIPRINFRPLPFEIVQMPDRVIMLYEIHHAFRIIPTDGRSPPEDAEPSYLGEASGHWDGDTFVVEVTSLNDKSWINNVGTIHTEDMKVTERYTRDSFDTIRYEATMVDPAVFTKPFTIRETFRLRPDERIREYECIESNEDIARFEKLLQQGELPTAKPQ